MRNGSPQRQLPLKPFGAQLSTMIRPKAGLLMVEEARFVEAKDGRPACTRADDGSLHPIPEGAQLIVLPRDNPEARPELWELVVIVQATRIKPSPIATPDDRVPMVAMGVGKPICRIPLDAFEARVEQIIAGENPTEDFLEW